MKPKVKEEEVEEKAVPQADGKRGVGVLTLTDLEVLSAFLLPVLQETIQGEAKRRARVLRRHWIVYSHTCALSTTELIRWAPLTSHGLKWEALFYRLTNTHRIMV